MRHWSHYILCSLIFTACFYYSNGCKVEGSEPPLPVFGLIDDIHRGIFLDRSTTGIEGIVNYDFGDVINNRRYVDVNLVDSRLVMTTNALFEQYEENETSEVMPITVIFRCTGGSTSSLTFTINVRDTNNNPPTFIPPPSGDFVFTIAAPVPPGYAVTGCLNDLTVRDIDLTTERIIFAIAENPYFEIEYDASSSITPKEFKAILRTKTFIRNIPEPIVLTISATDVDRTDGPEITRTTTITIIGNANFELPEEPVFSKTFYLAHYTNENLLVLTEPITLQNGYDEHVQFSIVEDFSDNFELVTIPGQENQRSIRVVIPLEGDVLTINNIHLIVRADREDTSGASATVVVQLPQVVPLEFQRAHYEGTIENNNLLVPQLILSQGYEGTTVSATVLNEHSLYFTAVALGNSVTVSMRSLPESVINENSFIYLEVVASTDRSTTTAIVTLEIIKDDNVTPVFNRPIYTGSYSPGEFTLEPILLVQGHEGIDGLILNGDHASYFKASRNEATVTIEVSTIPPEIYNRGRIVLSLEASKPRTVGASAAVIITLPSARELEFGASTYRGSLQDNVLNLDPIPLTVGYDDRVAFSITGDHASNFRVSNQENRAIITLVTPIPSGVILENSIVILTLSASGPNAVTTTTNVLLYIIKDDTTTPVFSRNIYYGTYLGISNFDIDDINLAQGFDDGVTFRIDGVHAQYFDVSNEGNKVAVFPKTFIPEDVISNEKVLVFNVLAEKALTVGASAAVSIRFPSDDSNNVILGFDRVTYLGSIQNNVAHIGPITVTEGYTDDVIFGLYGDLESHFTTNRQGSVVNVAIRTPIPATSIPKNRIITLEIRASAPQAISAYATLVFEVVLEDDTSPVVQLAFDAPYYIGSYNANDGLVMETSIALSEGQDATVEFDLLGEHSHLFRVVPLPDTVRLEVINAIPPAVLTSNRQLALVITAQRPGATVAQATIVIALTDDENTKDTHLGFDRVTYLGSIQNNVAHIGPITVTEGYTDDVIFGLYGDLESHFTTNRQGSVVNVAIRTPIPATSIPKNRIITLEIRASAPQAISAYATLVFEVVLEDDTSPVVQLAFDAPYYIGSYNANDGLVMETSIALSEGQDATVEFDLLGEHSHLFRVVPLPDTVRLEVINAIPPAVLTSNRQLVLVITAQRPGATVAQATIVIALTDDENTQGSHLGFDRVTYLGSIQNSVAHIGPITVTEGYTDDVIFGLYGDLESHFTTNRQGSVVNVAIRTPIPATSIPKNRIITLEIRASAPQAISAYATLVFEVVLEDDTSPVVQLAFDAPYYIGSYNANDGLVMETSIALSEGQDATVEFDLLGEHSHLLRVVPLPDTVRLEVINAIPPAVLTSNRQLVLVITAQRPGATVAQATIVIALTDDENTQGTHLGFDRVTYLGSIQNSVAHIGPITVTEGYTDDVIFGLYGDLESHFSTNRQGSVVNVAIRTPIPATSIPKNRIITLEIRASAPQAISAYATLVFEVVLEDDTSPVVQLAFDATYYIGSYNANDGLVMETSIALSEGQDATVEFDLLGEHSHLFRVVPLPDAIRLEVINAIPPAVLTSNRQLVLVITAQRPGATVAQATIVIALTDDENTQDTHLGFDRVTYLGSIQNNVAHIGPITVTEGYTDDVIFSLYGDLESHFTTNRQGSVVNVAIRTPIPATSIPKNRIITLEIRASAPQAISAYATLVFEVVLEDDTSPVVQLAFDAPYYIGSYNANDGLVMETSIALSEGQDATVEFDLLGEHSHLFRVVPLPDTVRLEVINAIPPAVLTSNRQLALVITAQRPGATVAQATIVIALTDDENTQGSHLGFDRVTYLGSIQNSVAHIGPITVTEGYTDDVIFGLYGDLESHFTTNRQGSVVNVAIRTPIPATSIPKNRIITLEIRASAPQAISAYATLVFEVVLEDNTSPVVQLAFDAPYYIGSYNANDGLVMETSIALSEGQDATVEFDLLGEHSHLFRVVPLPDAVRLEVINAIPPAVLTSNRQLVLVITAQRPGATVAQATIVIALTDDENTQGSHLGFDRVTYLGSIQNSVAHIGPITVTEGYTDDVIFGLYGDLESHFTTNRQGSVVNVAIRTPIPATSIPKNRIITLEIRASAPQAISAYATLVFEVVLEDDTSPVVQLAFDAPYYIGSYNANDGLVMETSIALSEGQDATVEFDLLGEHSHLFRVVPLPDTVRLEVINVIPPAVLTSNRQLVFVITAQRPGATVAQATIVISLTDDSQTGDEVSFERVFYNGFIQLDEIRHELITISGYDGTGVEVLGEYSSLFVGRVSEGVVSVQAAGSLTLPADVTHLALELHAAGARAVLLLNVLQPGVPMVPSVTFSSESYVLTVGMFQTGIVGRVSATADNRERVIYSLGTDNAHLQTRISISNEGELYMSAPANSGVYTFQVIATTVITQTTVTAPVYLTVEAISVCEDKGTVMPPLIILDRDEEEAHNNLVVLDSVQFSGCHFILTNRWPTDQNWLYVDENGLHTIAIDRESASIAFMAVSQVQVELILHCESDSTRKKRSERTNRLGSYDYGKNKWILTDTIPYNPRRSLVNLIVNDINDNNPIFVGKEHEPIAVGYPVDELEERILPRSLAELKATDADIGENAALQYWSSESVLAVAPTTGFVHVRTGARLQHDQLLTITATDKNGQGLSGTIQLVVKLLDLNHIAVMTIRDAFLDDEMDILAQLTDAVGYEVKTLRSVVISDDIDGDVTRNKRETGTTKASLQLYVYGLKEREPVTVDHLVTDITSNAAIVNVVSTVSLEDHLEDMDNFERKIGLLVTTIILSVLLFVVILLIAIWFFLRWRKNKSYDEFNDENSLTSRNASLGELPKPEGVKPRLNIQDLKKSEKRLQEMLHAPIEEVTVEPMTRKMETPVEAILDLPVPEPNVPIIIQSIDKLKDADETSDDEFGEISPARRKSVVTFNENVEKIIHVEDNADDDDDDGEVDVDVDASKSGYEVYRL